MNMRIMNNQGEIGYWQQRKYVKAVEDQTMGTYKYLPLSHFVLENPKKNVARAEQKSIFLLKISVGSTSDGCS